ncbi:MAG: hypothetical protein ACR2QE_04715 [Acidimicrobiales bacterium]
MDLQVLASEGAWAWNLIELVVVSVLVLAAVLFAVALVVGLVLTGGVTGLRNWWASRGGS